MTDNSRPGFPRESIDDSTLDRHLASLKLFDPRAGFEDRVMAQVVVAPPLWLQELKRNARSWIRTRQFRWLAAGMATTSTISLVVAATLVLNNLSTVNRAAGWITATVGLPIWSAVVGFVSGPAHDLLVSSTQVLGSREMFLLVSTAAVAFLAFCALMLFCLMRPHCPMKFK